MSPIPLAAAALLLAPALTTAVDNPDHLLAAARAKVLQTIDRLPRYLCTQTVERRESEIPGGEGASCSTVTANQQPRRLLTLDRLRLDVAISGDREIYSWVGENTFQERSLFKMVDSGTIADGAFSGFLQLVFRNAGSTLQYAGDEALEGRPAARFDFDVPVERSLYTIGGRSASAHTPYSGAVWIDPKTANLLRIVVRITKPTIGLQWCTLSTTLDYHLVRIRETDFLLPHSTVLKVVTNVGREKENRTVYSGCREFLGQSTISFEPSAEPAATKPSREITTPNGIDFIVEFTEPLDATKAAVGDPVRLRLVTPIGDVIPAGAIVNARIIRSQTVIRPPVVITSIRLETVEVDGRTIPLAARYDVPPDRTLGRIVTITTESAWFEFPTKSARFKRGQRMRWVTGVTDTGSGRRP